MPNVMTDLKCLNSKSFLILQILFIYFRKHNFYDKHVLGDEIKCEK